jgi:AraC-like DNA-binding protein
VQRFQGALRRAHRRASVDLADLAAAAGYFDQAHLTHEFNSLAGMSPSVLLAGRTEFLNHVVDRD